MIIGDQKIRTYLRDLPNSYLLDMLAEQSSFDDVVIRDVLTERGLELEEINQLVRRRLHSRIPRSYTLWQGARYFTLVSTLVVAVFNLVNYYDLLHGSSPLKGPLLILCAIGVAFGFYVGFKLTTHLYQGAPHRLYCGFPLPVGSIDLRTGKEDLPPRPLLLLCMAANATVGLALVLFPLLLIHNLLD